MILTAATGATAWLIWGPNAVVGTLLFGILATAVQAAATVFVRRAAGAPFPVFMKQWGIGMGFRLTGLVAFAVAVALRPEVFQPVPSALGYVGVVIPLLFLETRFLA
jgi:hypothetical protein